jgi:hypothetical protein
MGWETYCRNTKLLQGGWLSVVRTDVCMGWFIHGQLDEPIFWLAWQSVFLRSGRSFSILETLQDDSGAFREITFR